MKADWISVKEIDYTSYSLVKKFNLKKKIKKATIKVSALGWYHLYVNNQYPKQDVFKPGYTELQLRVQYQIYDITKFLKKQNELKILVGEGWMAKEFVAPIKDYITYPASLIYELTIIYQDNSKEVITSSKDDQLFTNHVSYANIYNGETQNKLLKPLKLHTNLVKVKSKLVPQEGERIIDGERIKPLRMWTNDIGETLIDFGQNYTGIVEIKVKGIKGDVITIKPAEVLDKCGHFYDENYRAAKSTYSYTLTGKEETYRPLFSFMGGRYIKIFRCPKYLKKENFTAVLVHSELRKTNTFECGNKKINRLYKNVIYGQLSNYLDIPTDCPQRNERLGWTADTQVFAKTAAINFDVKRFLNKWLKDLRLTQKKDGTVYSVIPTHNWGMRIGIGWGDACAMVPYQLYQAYGDKKIIYDNIECIKKWINYLLNSAKEKYIPYFSHIWGDWIAMDRTDLLTGHGSSIGGTSEKLLNVAYLAIDLSILIYFLKEIDKPYQKYEELLKKVKQVYQKKFIKNGHMIGKKGLLFSLKVNESCYTQTGLVYSLHFNLCKKEDRKTLIKDLVNLVHDCGNRLATGFLGTPYLLETLSENGYHNLAYAILFQEKFPSWLYSVNKGATTIWERYNGIKEDGTFSTPGMNSFNHYAYGAVYSWIFNNAVGIKIKKPGYEEIEISPIPDKRLGYVKSMTKTKFGDIKVYWDDKVYKISVPKGIKARIILDNHYNNVISNKEITVKR
ncbi:MAG: glycoside hydrolase family 78 protein [Bacilli bacterium]|nr:glycoside hydrolase family 78 protein [Bacilli bacterium]